MRIKTTSNLIAAVMVVLIAMTMLAVIVANHYSTQLRLIQDHLLQSQQMLTLFRKGADNMTYAVRAFAATADAKFRSEYDTELNITQSRQRAISGLAELPLQSNERALIEQALEQADGNVSKTARLLSVQRTTLIEKINKYDLKCRPEADAAGIEAP